MPASYVLVPHSQSSFCTDSSIVVAALRRVNELIDNGTPEDTLDALSDDHLKLQDLDDAGCTEYHANLKAAKASKGREVRPLSTMAFRFDSTPGHLHSLLLASQAYLSFSPHSSLVMNCNKSFLTRTRLLKRRPSVSRELSNNRSTTRAPLHPLLHLLMPLFILYLSRSVHSFFPRRDL